MDNKIIFKETQRFRQWWIWFILIGVNIISVAPLVSEKLSDNESMDNYILFVSLGIAFSLLLLFIFAKLETVITKEDISVRFFPFEFKYKRYNWSEVSRVSVRKYKPLSEYGGWGIRQNFKGKAYNVSGNMGMQLEFKNGKRLLIGTNKSQELEDYLNRNIIHPNAI